MSRYLVLLPAPEAEWAELPQSEHESGHRSHVQFHEDLAAGGHTIVAAGPLDEVLTDARLTETFGLPLEVRHEGGRWSARATR